MKSPAIVFILLLSIFPTLKMLGEPRDDNPFRSVKSYYEVCTDLDLKGNTITLPKDAVVSFRGGIIFNGRIVCNDNRFEGHNGIDETVALSGTVKGPFDVSVFQLSANDRSFDIGTIVNTASNVCKNIIVPDGTYFFSTPITLKNIRFYQQYGDLYYNGNATDVVTVQFYGGNSADICINGKIYYDTQNRVIKYTKEGRTNIIGLEFVNYNNSNVKIGDVAYFNNNIRVSGYGAGTSYNKFSIGLSAFSNEHLRIYQKNMPSSQIGWCNENIFIGGRFSNWSHFNWERCESVAIKLEGAIDGDSYNSVNSLLFIKPCMEGFRKYAIYAKNVAGCHWQDARTEGTKTFIKFVGDCRYNEANSQYGSEVIDYSESTTYPLIVKDLQKIYSTTDTKKIILEIDTNDSKLFKVVFSSPEARARIGISYVEKDGQCIPQTEQEKMLRPRTTSYPHSYYYNRQLGLWNLASDSSESEFVIPDNVTRIKIILQGLFAGVTIYSNRQAKIIEKY